MPERFVVTGSGRCGTQYLAAVLSAAGVPCGHEQVYQDDQVRSWENWQADSSWMAAAMLDRVDVPVVLLVRHPLAVVRSWVTTWLTDDPATPYSYALRRTAPEVYDWHDPADRALAMWLALNRATLTRAEVVLRLEELDADRLRRLIGWAGWPSDLAPVRYALKTVRGPVDQYQDKRTGLVYEPSWEDHAPELARPALELARSLGYREEMARAGH